MAEHSPQAMAAAEKVLIEYLKKDESIIENLSFIPLCDRMAAIIDEECGVKELIGTLERIATYHKHSNNCNGKQFKELHAIQISCPVCEALYTLSKYAVVKKAKAALEGGE